MRRVRGRLDSIELGEFAIHGNSWVKLVVTSETGLAVSRASKPATLVDGQVEARRAVKARAPIILLTLLASFVVPIMIGNVNAASCPPGNCQASVNSNVPSGDGTIWVEVDNNTSNEVPLPQTFNFAYNTTHTITVLNTTSFTGPSTGGHYVWKDWANYYGTSVCPGNQCVWTTTPMLRISAGGPNGIIYNYTGTVGFTAVFDKQYQATLSFSDINGNPLNPAPASLTLQPQGSTTTTTITSYTGYMSANLYTVTLAHWEGTDLVPTTITETIDLTNGPATATISLKAYPATIQIVDNNNNPVPSASVTITFVNSTSQTYFSNSKGTVNLGDIPGGSFGATVHYQNQAYGPYSLTAINNPINTIGVNAGSTPTTTTTAIVLLAIFGIAFFLILLAIKVRRPPGPPRIS